MTANPVTPWAPKKTARGVLLLTLGVAVVLPLALFGGVLVLSPIAKPAMIQAFVREVLGQGSGAGPERDGCGHERVLGRQHTRLTIGVGRGREIHFGAVSHPDASPVFAFPLDGGVVDSGPAHLSSAM